jgi:hypothetical protein
MPRWLKSTLKPTFADLLVVTLIFWALFLNPVSLQTFIGDANMGLHIRTGDWIRQHAAVPVADPYSFSRPGGEWFAFEWLVCLIYSWLHSVWGLPAIAGVSAVILGLFPVLVLRDSLARGASLLADFPLALLGFQAASIHYLARPHLSTMLLFGIAVIAIERDRAAPSRWIWALVPLAALWTNLHGGFLILPVYLGLLAAGLALESLWEPSKRRAAIRYAGVSAACAAASFANPYGWELHRHIYRFLGNSWITQIVQEYQPPWRFGGERMAVYFALAALAVAAALWLVSRRRFVEALWLAFFVYASMKSARHVPLFIIAAVPILAVGVTELWTRWTARASPRSTAGILNQMSHDLRPSFAGFSVWIVVAALLLAVDAFALFPREFPSGPGDYPKVLAERHRPLLEQGRLFTTDHWGDYLVYRRWPHQKVFVDGRSDYYGMALGLEYLAMLEAEPGWRALWDKWRFSAALLPSGGRLDRALRQDGWRVVEESGGAVLLVPPRYPETL